MTHILKNDSCIEKWNKGGNAHHRGQSHDKAPFNTLYIASISHQSHDKAPFNTLYIASISHQSHVIASISHQSHVIAYISHQSHVIAYISHQSHDKGAKPPFNTLYIALVTRHRTLSHYIAHYYTHILYITHIISLPLLTTFFTITHTLHTTFLLFYLFY
jgi:hypothetical protein